LFCQLCINKLKSGTGYWCCFDQTASATRENWDELAGYWDGYMKAYRGVQALNSALERDFPYNRAVLPCSRPACQGNCGFFHTYRDYWKGMSCPLNYQCPNANSCIFKHESEAATMQASLPQPLPLNPYDEQTAPKQKRSWTCGICWRYNNGTANCPQCGNSQFSH
jgi:hypothetical protein